MILSVFFVFGFDAVVAVVVVVDAVDSVDADAVVVVGAADADDDLI